MSRNQWWRYASVLSAFALSAPAMAIIVNGGSIVPEGDTWIGSWNGSSAVAVGPRTIVTAAHVGGRAGDVYTMNGVPYAASEVRAHGRADLMVVTLDADLPGWHTIGAALRGQAVTLGGMGFVAGEQLPGAIGWSDQRAEAWGTNTIDRASGGFLMMDFDAAIPNEAAFALHDSGGGVFVRGADGSLQLAGIAVGVGGPIGASVNGEGLYALDLAPYSGFITGFVPSPGASALLVVGTLIVPRRR